MKLAYCDKCKSLFPLPWNQEPRYCTCGRIGGLYDPDGAYGIAYLTQFSGCRMIAVDTNLIQGVVTQSQSYVFDWWESGFQIFLNGKEVKKATVNYVINNAVIFMNNALTLLQRRGSRIQDKKMILAAKELGKLIAQIKKRRIK